MPKTRHDTAYTAFALRKKSNAHAVSPDKYMHRQTNKCIEPQKTNKVDQTNKETMPRKEISLQTNKMHKVDVVIERDRDKETEIESKSTVKT